LKPKNTISDFPALFYQEDVMKFKCALHGFPRCEHAERIKRNLPEEDEDIPKEEIEYFEEDYDFICRRVRTERERKFEGDLDGYPCPLAMKMEGRILLELPPYVQRTLLYMKYSGPKPSKQGGCNEQENG
jgi:hypothetical protein